MFCINIVSQYIIFSFVEILCLQTPNYVSFCHFQHWNVGDFCRAVFSEDGLTYTAVIVSIDETRHTCRVRFIGKSKTIVFMRAAAIFKKWLPPSFRLFRQK